MSNRWSAFDAFLKAERLGLHKLDQAYEYSANLQRMIQRHCRGKKIKSPLFDTSPFLAECLNEDLVQDRQNHGN